MVNLLIRYYGLNNLHLFILILFLGIIFNLKITNFKQVKETRNKSKGYSKNNN